MSVRSNTRCNLKTYILMLKVIFSDTIFAIMQDSFLPKYSSSPHFRGRVWGVGSLFSPLQLITSRGQGSHALSKSPLNKQV